VFTRSWRGRAGGGFYRAGGQTGRGRAENRSTSGGDAHCHAHDTCPIFCASFPWETRHVEHTASERKHAARTLNPRFDLAAESVVMTTQYMAAVPAAMLRQPAAIDPLMQGF